MTTKEEEGMNDIPLRLHTVDWIEANVVTEAMIDWAIKDRSPIQRDLSALENRRKAASRAIAIGIHADAYRKW